MNCKQARTLMGKNINGLADSAETARLNQHIADCELCSREYAELAGLDRVLATALPLHATLGDDFATQVAERLTGRGNRLSTLKEAFLMSRLKFAIVAALVLAVGVGYLLFPRSTDSQALAAIQSAMAKVKSLHYKFEYDVQSRSPHNYVECWATPNAAKAVHSGVWWAVVKEGVYYNYLSEYKVLFIAPISTSRPAAEFGMMVDPRDIGNWPAEQGPRIIIRDVEVGGKPMVRIEVTLTKQAQNTELRRLSKKIGEVIAEIERREPPQRKVTPAPVVYESRLRTVFLADPSTDLVQSVDLYTPNPKGDGWSLIARIPSIDYNVDLPDDFFDVKTPPGTRVVDLRDGAEPEH